MVMVVKETQDIARCAFCGYEGIYGVEVVDTDSLDHNGPDAQVLGCKEINKCFARGGTNRTIY